jgi:hypothetical protein
MAINPTTKFFRCPKHFGQCPTEFELCLQNLIVNLGNQKISVAKPGD